MLKSMYLLQFYVLVTVIFLTIDSSTSSTVYDVVVTDEAEDVSLMPSVNVLAYNNYTVSVQAFTGAGGGETVDIIILSPQAGTYIHSSTVEVLQSRHTEYFHTFATSCMYIHIICMHTYAFRSCSLRSVFVSCSGPSAPVASVTVVSSTAISVTWTQPEFLNGVLQSYTVTGTLLLNFIQHHTYLQYKICILTT